MKRWVELSLHAWFAAGFATVGCSPQRQLSQVDRQSLDQRLCQAAILEEVDRCADLIDAGADINGTLDQNYKVPDGTVVPMGRTPVRIAIDRKNPRLLRMLLDRGANPDQKDDMGWTPLERFLEAFPKPGPEELALELIEHGAKVNTHGGFLFCGVGADPGTPLHEASFNNLLRVAKALIGHGAEINARSWRARTPLHWASSPEMIALLLQAGADLEARDDTGLTPLAGAVEGCWPEAVLALLRAGAKPGLGRSDSYMPSLFHKAIFRSTSGGTPEGWATIVEALIKSGADINQANEFLQTPLLFASDHVAEIQEDLALVLLSGGADPKLRNDVGSTALHCAVDRRLPRLVRELLRKGVDVSAKNEFGDTPLHQACFVFDRDTQYILALVAAGADIHAKNKDGLEPLDLADAKKRETVASLLEAK